jgi:aspartyl-tRNA(Asn)/glutamyl-tRNA(Gln) amidotransferase subunit C
MMGVSRKDVEKIAALAELAVDDATAAELERQLSRILDYVAQLGEAADDASVAGDERKARLRRDEVAPDPLSRAPGEIAPAFSGGLFTVPRLGELDRGNDVP